MAVDTWADLAAQAVVACDKVSGDKSEYIARLKFELKEINKQAVNSYWLRLYNSGQKFNTNKNGLVFPFLLGITDIDPIKHQKIYLPSDDGSDGEIISITVGGEIINIPAENYVLTKRGKLLAKNLEVGDELC